MWAIVLVIIIVLLIFYMRQSNENFDTYGNTLEAAKFLTGPNKALNAEIYEKPDIFLRYDWHNKDAQGMDPYDKLYEEWTYDKQQADRSYDLASMVAEYGATVAANPVQTFAMGQKIRLMQKEF